MKARPLSLLMSLGLAFAPAWGADAAPRSPFLAPQPSDGAVVATEGAPIEFRGVQDASDGQRFLIYDPTKKTSIWARLNDKSNDFVVKAHDDRDPRRETISVEMGGKTLTLALRESKVTSAGSAAVPMPVPSAMPGAMMPGAPMPQQPTPVVSQAVTGTVVLNPTAQDEANRLQAVVDEYRRRREQRAVGSTQTVPFAAPPPPQPGQAIQVQPQQQMPPVQPPQNQGNIRQRPQTQRQ